MVNGEPGFTYNNMAMCASFSSCPYSLTLTIQKYVDSYWKLISASLHIPDRDSIILEISVKYFFCSRKELAEALLKIYMNFFKSLVHKNVIRDEESHNKMMAELLTGIAYWPELKKLGNCLSRSDSG